MKNTYTVVHAVAIFWFSVFAHAGEFVKPAPLPIEQMRAVAYTKAFAKRFALPEPEPGTEPEGGIEAMGFSVEQGRDGSPYCYCKLKLYLDSNLPVAYPEEGVAGSDHMLIQSIHFFMWPDSDNKRWMSLREKDRLHFNERLGRYNQKAAWATADFDVRKKQGFATTTIWYNEYHRDLFPGLAYAKLDVGCPAENWKERYPNLQLWLEREGGKNYRKTTLMDGEDFLKFNMPKPLMTQILGFSGAVSRYNSILINEEDRQRREAQAKRKSPTQN